jgi:hypothetical protein
MACGVARAPITLNRFFAGPVALFLKAACLPPYSAPGWRNVDAALLESVTGSRCTGSNPVPGTPDARRNVNKNSNRFGVSMSTKNRVWGYRFVAFITTRSGERIYARDRGLKAFRIKL